MIIYGALDVTCKDDLKQPYVIASLAETVLFQRRLLIQLEPMSYVDTSMVIRIMGYDINNIQTQCRNIRSDMEHSGKVNDSKVCNFLTKLPHLLSLEPCVSCVLNLSEQKWTGYSGIEDMHDPQFNESGVHPSTVGI